MYKVLAYSVLLICGMMLSQMADLSAQRLWLNTLTMICLSYIMIEVGLEFHINKRKLGSYGKDYFVAATTAAFPWIFCTVYFFAIFGQDYKQALLLGRFAAPTSAGVLFTMLAAMGLAHTWLFKKARVLAIFDDLDTILLMIPLQILLVGLHWEIFIVIPISILLLWMAYRYLHSWNIGASNLHLFIYGTILAVFLEFLRHSTMIQVEVLLPAFVLGCLIKNPHPENTVHIEDVSPEQMMVSSRPSLYLDALVKLFFMFLVGASLPKIDMGSISYATLATHVVIVTVLSNLGKLFPIFFYKNEASLKRRFALSVAMFPRGEVGAGVLLLAMSYGLKGPSVTVATLSLALNLVLTGPFIWIVMRLIRKDLIRKIQKA